METCFARSPRLRFQRTAPPAAAMSAPARCVSPLTGSRKPRKGTRKPFGSAAGTRRAYAKSRAGAAPVAREGPSGHNRGVTTGPAVEARAGAAAEDADARTLLGVVGALLAEVGDGRGLGLLTLDASLER